MRPAPVAAAAVSSANKTGIQSTLTEANLENLGKNFKGESFGSKDMINPFATGMNFAAQNHTQGTLKMGSVMQQLAGGSQSSSMLKQMGPDHMTTDTDEIIARVQERLE